MNKTANINQITEGITDFLVFKKKITSKGPGAKDKQPFYNSAMELNRDLSILVCQWLVDNNKKHLHFLDGLAASGVRGVRIKNEVEGDFDVTINDGNIDAYNLIKENIKHSGLKNVNVLNKNLNTLLSEKKYDYIDIDPFGSPAYFIDSAMRSIKNNGILACTATDTATLCGVYPKVCNRRYGAMPFHSFFMKEIGLRILLGFICKEALKYDKGIKPLVCYGTDHYFRAYVTVRNGTNFANETIKNLSIINSNEFVFSKKPHINVGPLWTGKIENKQIIKELRSILFKKHLNTKNSLWKLLDLLEEEDDIPGFFYTTDDIASTLKTSPPKLDMVFKKLKNKGYTVSRTHFSPTGFKTNAPRKKIEAVFKNDSQVK
jgi:tRNA (guanine26-N2/guanine27-N2)-dimethyltransferase